MRLGVIFATIAYALAVLFVAGLAMALLGDCAAGTTDFEAQDCARNATLWGLLVIVVGSIIYAATWRYAKKHW